MATVTASSPHVSGLTLIVASGKDLYEVQEAVEARAAALGLGVLHSFENATNPVTGLVTERALFDTTPREVAA